LTRYEFTGRNYGTGAIVVEKTDAIVLLGRNLNRTEMLIEAMTKIKAYNRLYQMGHARDREYLEVVRGVQDKQLEEIEQSCAEHAIVSLATAFETYYKELLQQLLCEYPDYFLSRDTKYSDRVNRLIKDSQPAAYEEIGQALNLGSRFDYYAFFKAYAIPFLSSDEEGFIEYVYIRRNSYVHNAGRPDARTRKKFAATSPPFNEYRLSTEAKRLRTRFGRILCKSYDRMKAILAQG
jgi:hypothetical protein